MITKLILIITTLFIFCSCTEMNSNAKKSITSGDDTLSEMDISFSKMDAVEALSQIDEPVTNKIIFKASGTEPGWYAQIYNNKLRFIANYGKDSVTINNKFDDILNKKDYLYNNAEDFIISVKNLPCIASGSGNTEDRTVVITFKGKDYKGCGSFSH